MSNCNIVKDLIPLYIEELTTDESSIFVEEHINKCSECNEYYKKVKKDYEENVPVNPSNDGMSSVMNKVIKYEKNIKLISISIAMFITSIIIGGRVQLLDTIPVLILVPIMSRLFYKKSLTIILLSIPNGLLAGIISGDIKLVLVYGLVIPLSTIIGCLIVRLFEKSLVASDKLKKRAGTIISVILILMFCVVNNYFYGNPITYISNLIKVRSYVSEKYEFDELYSKDTLDFKRMNYNYRVKYYDAEYITHINRWSREESVYIKLDKGNIVDDGYANTMALKFAEERSTNMQINLSEKIKDKLFVSAYPKQELDINKYALNEFYPMVTMEDEKYSKVTKDRNDECSKLEYDLIIGTSSWDMDKISKDDFIHKSIDIYNEIKKEGFLYESINIKSYDQDGNIQKVSISMNQNESDIVGSYEIESIN